MDKVERGKRVLECLARQDNVIFCTDPSERAIAKRYLSRMPEIFPDYIAQLDAVYLYRQSEQTSPDWKRCDGMNTLKSNTAEGRLFRAIGLSVEALHDSPEYFKSVFIHELAHIAVQEHGEKFNQTVSDLRHAYQKQTSEPLTLEGMEI